MTGRPCWHFKDISGKKYVIFVAIDDCTKWAETALVKEKQALKFYIVLKIDHSKTRRASIDILRPWH